MCCELVLVIKIVVKNTPVFYYQGKHNLMTNYCHLNLWTLETECHSVISGLLVCLHQSTRSTPSKLSLIGSAYLFFLHYLTTPGKSKAVQGKVQVHLCMNVRPVFEMAQLKIRTAHGAGVVHFVPQCIDHRKGRD